jgi:hypothetical protein
MASHMHVSTVFQERQLIPCCELYITVLVYRRFLLFGVVHDRRTKWVLPQASRFSTRFLSTKEIALRCGTQRAESHAVGRQSASPWIDRGSRIIHMSPWFSRGGLKRPALRKYILFKKERVECLAICGYVLVGTVAMAQGCPSCERALFRISFITSSWSMQRSLGNMGGRWRARCPGAILSRKGSDPRVVPWKKQWDKSHQAGSSLGWQVLINQTYH